MNLDKITKIVEKLENHEKRIQELENLLSNKNYQPKTQLEFSSFYYTKDPKTDIQKILIICYFLENTSGMSSFNAKDIEQGFREVKEIVPNNINYNVIKNIEKGFLMETKEKKDKLKAWNITRKGEIYVENDLR